MTSRDKFEREILSIFGRVVARDVNRKKITPDAAFKTELQLDSMGLVSLVYLIEEAFDIDLMAQTEQLARAVVIREIVDIAFGAYAAQHGAG